MVFYRSDVSANAKRPYGWASGRRGHASTADADDVAAPPAHGGTRRRRPSNGAVSPFLRAVAARPSRAARATAAWRALRAAGRRGRWRRGTGRAPRAFPADSRRAGRWPVAASGGHTGRRRRTSRATLCLRLYRRPREAQAHPAAARIVTPRTQVSASRVAGQW